MSLPTGDVHDSDIIQSVSMVFSDRKEEITYCLMQDGGLSKYINIFMYYESYRVLRMYMVMFCCNTYVSI